MRIAVLFDIIGPYHRARLLAANRRMEVIGVEARKRSFVYDWDQMSGRDNLQIIRLTESVERRSLARKTINQALDDKLLPQKPDVVAVPGWSGVAPLATLAWAARHRIPTLLMSETNVYDVSRSHFLELTKRYLVRSYAAGLVGGETQKAYLIKLGLSANAVALGYDAVDNTYFAQGAEAARRLEEIPSNCKLGRKHFGHFFLSVARMVHKKNLIRLIQSYAHYLTHDASGEPWPLVILGEGPLRSEIEKYVALRNLSHVVILPGFEQYERMPNWYGAAGCFILASIREQWGLVVNEAMASGIPVLVSNRSGCASTLVQEGVNGWTFDPSDIEGMANAMTRVANANVYDRASMGEASKRIIGNWGVERFAKGLEVAAQFAIANGSRSIGLAKRMAIVAIAAIQEHRSVSGFE